MENNHEERMKVILIKDANSLANMLAYISGALGENLAFHGAFEDAIENAIFEVSDDKSL